MGEGAKMGDLSQGIGGVAVTAVTLTQQADTDDLSDQDYWEVYHFELRGWDEGAHKYRVSLDAFIDLVHSTYSKALWSKYHNGVAPLNRRMRNELRTAVGMQPLPPTVAEAVATADGNARVVQLGTETPDQVLLIGDPGPLTIMVNGEVTAWRNPSLALPRLAREPRVRKHYIRPVASDAQAARRSALGVSWGAVLDAGLAALEAGGHD